MLSFLKKELSPFPKKKVVLSEKVTPSEKVEKGTNLLNEMEEPVHTIHRKCWDNFQGQYTGSTGWINLDHEWLKIKFSTLEPDFYKRLFEKDIEGQDIDTYKTFVLQFDNNKLNLSMHNDSVKTNREKNS